VTQGFCTRDQLGRFIFDLPEGKSINNTSFWSARLQLPASNGSLSTKAFWNNPAGNPTPPLNNYTSPWRRRRMGTLLPRLSVLRQLNNSGPSELYRYTAPIQYPVRKTGYYCVGEWFCSTWITSLPIKYSLAAIPGTSQASNPRASTDVPYHPSYSGTVLFKNTFEGKLPATDYPKVNVCFRCFQLVIPNLRVSQFYFALFLVYSAFAAGWGWLCYRHIHELLPLQVLYYIFDMQHTLTCSLQYYLSGLVGLLVIEMVANWGECSSPCQNLLYFEVALAYYRYLNAHGKSTASTVFLIVGKLQNVS
jgi:hypothetical protein